MLKYFYHILGRRIILAKRISIPNPIIKEVTYSPKSLQELRVNRDLSDKSAQYIFSYPTVYIIDQGDKQAFSVYVGETSNILSRTQQHLLEDVKYRSDWKLLYDAPDAYMYIIGHEFFNKSLTLDIENRLMMYLSSVDKVKTIFNRRTNPQTNYYTSEYLDQIFTKIWQQLRKRNKDLFPLESVIRDSALFKASPFHKLTQSQIDAKDKIIQKIHLALRHTSHHKLILVNGEAGSGKTVLMSNLFFELWQDEYDDGIYKRLLSPVLLVNHDQQLKVYQQIAQKLGLIKNAKQDIITKPTSFINRTSPNQVVDLVIIDEAHLLWTQGKQSYRGKNQLLDILDRAKVVVAVFDQKQILNTNQYWEKDLMLNMISNQELERIDLKEQLRMNGSEATVKWIRNFIDHGKVSTIPYDKDYEIRVFDHPAALEKAIVEKNSHSQKGISRVIATFDWEYVDKRKPDNGDYWLVEDKDWSMPWNLQLPVDRGQAQLPWSEQSNTIKEVGSTYTVQGFDLNYAGLIIGPSVKFRDGKIIFDPSASANKKATQRRTISATKEKIEVANDLLKNELNVLMTRGVNGLYLYAVDPALQAILKKAQKGDTYGYPQTTYPKD